MKSTTSYLTARKASVLSRVLIVATILVSGSAVGDDNRGSSDGYSASDWEAVWMPERVSLDDPRWGVEDIACAGCPLASYKYMQELLQDPKNDDRSLEEIVKQVEKFSARSTKNLLTAKARESLAHYDPAASGVFDCTPDGDGLLHQVFAPLPFEIEMVDDKVLLRYEYWNAVRSVHLDDRVDTGARPARLGYSVGRFEGSTLVVETTGLVPAPAGVLGGEIELSSDARIVERYTISANGERLDLAFSIFDPVNFREPFVQQKAWLRSPGWELLKYECETTTGEY